LLLLLMLSLERFRAHVAQRRAGSIWRGRSGR